MGDTSFNNFKKEYQQRTANMVQKIYIQTFQASFLPRTLSKIVNREGVIWQKKKSMLSTH